VLLSGSGSVPLLLVAADQATQGVGRGAGFDGGEGLLLALSRMLGQEFVEVAIDADQWLPVAVFGTVDFGDEDDLSDFRVILVDAAIEFGLVGVGVDRHRGADHGSLALHSLDVVKPGAAFHGPAEALPAAFIQLDTLEHGIVDIVILV